MSEEAAAEEVNHVRFTIEETPLNIDSYPVRFYGSFSQKENLSVSSKIMLKYSNFGQYI